MVRIKTFTNELKIFHAMNELKALDNQVNEFILKNDVKRVISVADTTTVSEGNTVGIIRVLTYES